MGRSVVESLVAVIKEVPNPTKHPGLAPLLRAQLLAPPAASK